MLPERFEFAGVGGIGTSGNGKYRFGPLLAHQSDPVDLQQSKSVRYGFRGPRSDEQWYAIDSSLPLQPRCKIYAVTHRRVLESHIRSHIADHTVAGIDADPDFDWHKRNVRLRRFLLTLLVERAHTFEHIQVGI